MQVNEYKPKIVAFCCNWCSYAGADLAGSNRLGYPADVKIIRVPCSCRVNPMFILRAFQRGADGVILCGCHPGDCHYTSGNYFTRRRMALLFSMLDYLGIEKTEKVMFTTFVRDELYDGLVRDMYIKMNIGAAGNGIAVFIPIDSIGGGSSLNYFAGEGPVQKKEKKSGRLRQRMRRNSWEKTLKTVQKTFGHLIC